MKDSQNDVKDYQKDVGSGTYSPKQGHAEVKCNVEVISLVNPASETCTGEKAAKETDSLEVVPVVSSRSLHQNSDTAISLRAKARVSDAAVSGISKSAVDSSDLSMSSISPSRPKAAEAVAVKESSMLKEVSVCDANDSASAATASDEAVCPQDAPTQKDVVSATDSTLPTLAKAVSPSPVEVITVTDSPAKPSGSAAQDCLSLSTEDIVRSMCHKVIAGKNTDVRGFVAEGVAALMLARDPAGSPSHSPKLLEDGKGKRTSLKSSTDVDLVIEIDDNNDDDGGEDGDARKGETRTKDGRSVLTQLNGGQSWPVSTGSGAVNSSTATAFSQEEQGQEEATLITEQSSSPTETPADLDLSLQITSYRSLSANIVHFVSGTDASHGSTSPSSMQRRIPSNSLQPQRTIACACPVQGRKRLHGTPALQGKAESHPAWAESRQRVSQLTQLCKDSSGCSQATMTANDAIVLSDSD